MSSIAACLTIFGVISSLLTGMILPSIFIFAGEYGAKKRSDAFFSTISLNSGLTFIKVCTRKRGSECPSRILFHDPQALGLLFSRRRIALALQLDPETQLVLRVRIAHGLFVRDRAALVQIEERLVEGLHAEASRLGHDVLDMADFALEDEIRDQR